MKVDVLIAIGLVALGCESTPPPAHAARPVPVPVPAETSDASTVVPPPEPVASAPKTAAPVAPPRARFQLGPKMVDASTGWALVVPPRESVDDSFAEHALLVARTTDGGATWTVFPRHDANDRASDLWIASATTALASIRTGADGEQARVDRTTDSGLTWTRTKLALPLPDGGGPSTPIAATMFGPGGGSLHVEMPHGMNSEYGYGFATKDHGVTWTRLPGGGFRMRQRPSTGPVPRVATTVSETTTASGRRFRLRAIPKGAADEVRLETSKDARAWSLASLGFDQSKTSVTSGPLFFESTGCLVAGDATANLVVCTTDAGASWRTVHVDAHLDPQHGIRELAAPPRAGWVVLYTDKGIRSLRQGDDGTWAARDFELPHRKGSVLDGQPLQLLSDDVARATVDGVLYGTDDGGRTFQPIPARFSDEP